MVSAQSGAMLFGVLTIGIGTASRRPERRKTMKTKTNVKAGTISMTYGAVVWVYTKQDGSGTGK